MSGEREITGGSPAHGGPDDGNEPDMQRLREARRQAAAFDAAANRAFALGQRRAVPVRQILESIRNTSGQ